MGKRVWVLFLFFVALIGLAGCFGQSEKEKQLEKKVAELEEKIEQEKLKEEEKSKEEEEETEEELKPVVLNVIDPTTKAVIRTIKPEELGFGVDNGAYKAEIEKWARELARGSESTPGYDKRLIPDKIDENGQVIKGSPMTILDESELVEKVIEASGIGGDVELPLYITASGYKMEDVAHLDEVVVAKYTTYFNNAVAGRTKNIELSAQAIDNLILGAGDTFSFNTTLGPSDEAHGYQPAEEIVNGKLVMGIGGGICQTSSTLYNAIDVLGVGYIEKHHHSLTVGYVPKGRDATVSYGGKDFRFENTTGVPLMLNSVFEKGKLTIEVRTSKQYEALIKKGI